MIDPEQLDVVLTDVDERHRRVRRHVHGAKFVPGSTPRISNRVASMEIVHIHEGLCAEIKTKVSLPSPPVTLHVAASHQVSSAAVSASAGMA